MNNPTAGQTGTCRSCGAAILWRSHVRTRKLAPIDADPTEDGNVELVADDAYAVHSSPPLLAGPLRTSHFVTCPNAPDWKRR